MVRDYILNIMAKKSDKNEKDAGLIEKLNNAKTEIKKNPEEKVIEKQLQKPNDPSSTNTTKGETKESPKSNETTESKSDITPPVTTENKTEPEIENSDDDLLDLLGKNNNESETYKKEGSSEVTPKKESINSIISKEIKDVNLLRKIENPNVNKPECKIPKTNMDKKEVMDVNLERIRQKTLKEELKRRSQINNKTQITPKSARDLLKQPEKKILVRLKDDRVIEVNPNTDKVFAFLCRGFDESLKEPCYRYVKSLTFRQTVNFKRFIEEFGCMCRDRTNNDIILDQYLDQIQKDLPIKLKEYDKDFIKIYYDEYALNSVMGLVNKVVENAEKPEDQDEQEDSDDDNEDSDDTTGFSEDDLEEKAKSTQDDDGDINDSDE